MSVARSPRLLVVGAAIVRRTRLLAQQRRYPAEAAGRWELPGGRVEEGETEHEAVARECREELGITVLPARRVGEDVALPEGVLRVYAAVPADPAATPRSLEHRQVRWVGSPELAELDWLEADRALVPALEELLRE